MSLTLKNKTHCVLLRSIALYLANSVLKSVLGIFLSIWLENFLTAFGKYCCNILGVIQLQTVSFVFVCPGSDQRYSSGPEIVRKFGTLWVGILLGNLYLGKVVGRNCELRPLYLRVQVPTRNISSGLGIARKFGDLVVRKFCNLGSRWKNSYWDTFFPFAKITLLSCSFCVFSRSDGLSDHQRDLGRYTT